jgi:hypothetical protein
MKRDASSCQEGEEEIDRWKTDGDNEDDGGANHHCQESQDRFLHRNSDEPLRKPTGSVCLCVYD